jgi:hypothetical protein
VKVFDPYFPILREGACVSLLAARDKNYFAKADFSGDQKTLNKCERHFVNII